MRVLTLRGSNKINFAIHSIIPIAQFEELQHRQHT